MRARRFSRETKNLLPFVAALLLWLGVLSPLRAEKESRLTEQSQIRRERATIERSNRETRAMLARIDRALSSACRASTEPAALRERVVAAAQGLGLSPLSLSVRGGPDGGAQVEITGTRSSVQEMMRRLGDPARGGFLRAVTMRDRATRWNASITTGVIGSRPPGLPPLAECPGSPDPPRAPESPDPGPPSSPRQEQPLRPPAQAATSHEEVPPPVFVPEPEPPFSVIAFLRSAGKSRVSLRVGNEVRVVSVGDSIEGWTCISIDRDEGAVFTSPTKDRLVLKGEAGH